MKRQGRETLVFQDAPWIAAHCSIAGPKEGEGPLAGDFDEILEDDLLGQKSWELAESEMLRRCVSRAIREGGVAESDVDALLSGDLNSQIMASGFAARGLGLPFLGLYGACSTFVEGLLLASALISGGFLKNAVAAASSHFCTAERQFRSPLELGTQRPPSASWTATAAGAALVRAGSPQSGPALRVRGGTLGRVLDLEVKDANHMGAAMAPAVCDCISRHLENLGRSPLDYDRVVTGDLGWIGREILLELLQRRGVPLEEERLGDCGASLYFPEQDAHAGGSGCGCVASVSCGTLMKRMERGELTRVLLTGSGAMLSPTSSLQGQVIPGIAYAVELEVC